MTEQSRPKMQDLELNRETLQDLTEPESEQAKGGWVDPDTDPVMRRPARDRWVDPDTDP